MNGSKKTAMRERDGQRGIVIGPILFLIAIIGVLAAAIAAGAGSFTGSSSKSGAKVLASAIIDYANTVQIGVDRVLANGCDETEISFENPIISGYTNPNAPADKSCHVFSVNGGGIIMKTPPVGAQSQADYDAAYLGIKPPLGLYFVGLACAMGVGSGGYGTAGVTNPCYYISGDRPLSIDLVMVLPWIDLDVCLQINSISGFRNRDTVTPPTNGNFNLMDSIYFRGNYSLGYGGIVLDTTYGNPNNLGAMQGCLATSKTSTWPGGGYIYFRVLLAR